MLLLLRQQLVRTHPNPYYIDLYIYLSLSLHALTSIRTYTLTHKHTGVYRQTRARIRTHALKYQYNL